MMLANASMHGLIVPVREDKASDSAASSSPQGEGRTERRRRQSLSNTIRVPAGLDARPARLAEDYFAGLYQLSRPSCSFLAAASGVSVPLITLADSTQVSFSRFGVPRDRIW